MSGLAPPIPGPRPPWWRPSARKRWRRDVQRYLRESRSHLVFVHCIEHRIPMPAFPSWWHLSDAQFEDAFVEHGALGAWFAMRDAI